MGSNPTFPVILTIDKNGHVSIKIPDPNYATQYKLYKLIYLKYIDDLELYKKQNIVYAEEMKEYNEALCCYNVEIAKYNLIRAEEKLSKVVNN